MRRKHRDCESSRRSVELAQRVNGIRLQITELSDMDIDLEIPPDAEIVIEGMIEMGMFESEGPFGESGGKMNVEVTGMASWREDGGRG
jgi:UbiD family decarboxylase